MNDKELLMMAAKAASLKCKWFKVKKWQIKGNCKICCGHEDVFGTHHAKPWNPLKDDGAALRLAVKLRMDINISHRTNEVIVFTMTEKINRVDEIWGEDVDEYAATRRAIVRAAAEIGSKL